MSDGFKVIVKLNDVPIGQYAQGNSVIFQGDTVDEVAELIARAIPGGNDDNGHLIIGSFATKALVQAAGDALKQAVTVAADATNAIAPEAPAAPPADTPASAGLMKVAAQKSGKTVEELGALTTAEAKEIIASAA